MMDPVVPGVVMIPASSAGAIFRPKPNKKKKLNVAADELSVQSLDPLLLESERQRGQDLLRQLVYGETSPNDTQGKVAVDIHQVDWKAVIVMAEQLHKREQKMLRKLKQKRSHPNSDSRSTERTISTETPRSDSNRTISTATPRSASNSPSPLSSHMKSHVSEAMHAEQERMDHLHESTRCLPSRGLFSRWIFPWRQMRRKKVQPQTLIQDTSSFSINLVACADKAGAAPYKRHTEASHCRLRHTQPSSSLSSTANTHPQQPRKLQQVVSVGCTAGIFGTFRRQDLDVPGYDLDLDHGFTSNINGKEFDLTTQPFSTIHDGTERNRDHKKTTKDHPLSSSSQGTDPHYSSSMSSSTNDEDLNFLF